MGRERGRKRRLCPTVGQVALLGRELPVSIRAHVMTHRTVNKGLYAFLGWGRVGGHREAD